MDSHSTRVPFPDLIDRLLQGRDLSAADTAAVMDAALTGEASPARLAGFLVALRAKGAEAAELSGLAEAVLRRGTPLDLGPGPVLDLAGTGGSRVRRTGHAVNVSTMAAVVTAAALGGRAVVAKHGGRAASSRCGSADLLEHLGLDLALPPDRVAAVGRAVGLTFCHAPLFHPSLRHAGPVRRELGVPTAFNLLAPLVNPARPTHQLVGVADAATAPTVAAVLARRGTRALVVTGDEGIDELGTAAPSTVLDVRDGHVTPHRLDPRDLGIAPPRADGPGRGGDRERNAAVLRATLAGEPGPVRDAVLLNAGAALSLLGPAEEPGTDLAARLAPHLAACAAAVDSGAAAALLDTWLATAAAAAAGTAPAASVSPAGP